MSIPDHYRSPRGNVWTTMCAFNWRCMAELGWPEPEDGDVTPAINEWRCRALMTQIIWGRSPDRVNDGISLVRVVQDEDGFPKLLLTCRSRSEVDQWKRLPSKMEDLRTYVIDGEHAHLHLMQNEAIAIMRWSAARRERFFALWRWELALASLAPYDPLMLAETHDAREDQI